MLDPQARALLDQMAAAGLPPVHRQTPTEARRDYLARRHTTQPDAPPLHEVRELLTPDGIPLRLYRPSAPRPGAPGPALVYLHGGGWVMGDLDTHDVLCRQLALGAGVTVLAVHYRLAPEHPFPAAVVDAVAAVRWVQAQARELGIDDTRLAVGGDSAGGNLAAVVALTLRDAPGAAAAPALAAQLLIYPASDMRGGSESHRRNGQGYLLTADSMAYYRGHYCPDPDSWSDWRASPLLAPRHDRLPPALVLTAGFDPLLDEGRAYADALSAAGTPCQYLCYARQIHGFVPMSRILDEARGAVAACCAFLRERLAV